jgi:predicted RNA binding protein YcfA (HicA-like mRNA interferase family)
MPKLPHLSGAQVQRARERRGFVKVRQSGSHVIMKRDTKGCVEHLHDEVKLGTLAGVLRQAEVAPEEFLQALKR